jgi:hypothetical protein
MKISRKLTVMLLLLLLIACAVTVYQYREQGLKRFNHLRAARKDRWYKGGMNATTDTYLSDLQIPNPSKAVQEAVSRIPVEDAIVFVGIRGETNILVYYCISYLSWPREVGLLECDRRNNALFSLHQPRDEKKVRWLMYDKVAPAPAHKHSAIAIGPSLSLVPLTEMREWKYYCSQ